MCERIAQPDDLVIDVHLLLGIGAQELEKLSNQLRRVDSGDGERVAWLP